LLTTPAYVGTWSNTLGTTTHTLNQLVLGDGSIGSNAKASTRCFYVTQMANADLSAACASSVPSAVPEPAPWLLFGGSAVSLLAQRARLGKRRR
jgi:hypothetical protein